jgi:outer membrane immunogenic protein
VGGVASYAWGDGKHCDDLTCSLPGIVYPDVDVDGWLGGVTVGYNYQMGSLVTGIEADWSWGDVSGSSPDTDGFGCVGSCDTEVNWIGTVRGRLGYAFDHVLAYATAGVAFTEYDASIGKPVLAQGTTTETSFTGGGGIEYAFAQHWSAKVEYLYIHDFDDFAYDFEEGACGAPPGNCFARTDHINKVRLGVNYRF